MQALGERKRRMSDVTRHFGENIVLRGPADWATQVEQHLTGALMFRTGHAVIRSIWDRTPRTVRITPWTAAGANADANPQNWRDATPAGLRRRDLDGHDQTGAPGTGAGSSSRVRYSPGRFRADTVLRVPPHGVLLPGVQVNGGDEQTTVLIHELSHSLRHLYAAFHPEVIPEARTTAVSSGGLPRAFDNSEELFAITVRNVYCS